MGLALLAVHAHPDDESIGTGGTLALYARQGVKVILVCATRGEEGEIHNVETREDPGEIRTRELLAACKVLGLHDLKFLGYRDSGMAGAPSNRNPDAFCNADPKEAAGRLAAIIRETCPQVVITYNERGFYGHPDHVAANRVTRLALEEAARAGPCGEPPWDVSRLFYTAAPRSRLHRMREALRAKGEDLPYPVEMLATEDEEIRAWVDVRPVLDVKMQAISCHLSQLGPRSLINRLPQELREEAFGTECYVAVRGCHGLPRTIGDLFWGMR